MANFHSMRNTASWFVKRRFFARLMSTTRRFAAVDSGLAVVARHQLIALNVLLNHAMRDLYVRKRDVPTTATMWTVYYVRTDDASDYRVV